MQGIKFGEYHSWNDFSLILSEKTIGTPSTKTETIDIPGGDGVLDLTDIWGEPKYSNRKLSFEFSTIVPRVQFPDLFAKVQNALHGRKLDISLDDDPEWYYTGRISVSEWKAEKNVGKLTIDCDCEPYRHRVTSQVVYLCGRNLLNLDTGMATSEEAWTKTETGYSFTRGAVTGGTFAYFEIPVKKGQQYIFSADYSLTMLYVYKDSLYGTPVAIASEGNSAIFTAEDSGIYVFGLYVASTSVYGEFSNVMVQEGNTKGAYVAYDSTEKEVEATFSNTRKSAVPTMYTNSAIVVESPSNYYTLATGANVLPEFTFFEGNNTLNFSGNGIVVVEWKEGGL